MKLLKEYGSGILCGIIAVIITSGSIKNVFLRDDIVTITENPYASPPLDLKGIMLSNSWGNRTGYRSIISYRPFATFTCALNKMIFGNGAESFYAVNMALHGICTFLVFLLALYLFQNQLSAFFAGQLFALMPVHAETVALAVNRADLLCSAFYLSSLIFFFKFLQKRSIPVYIFSLLCFVFSLLSKESGSTLPVVCASLIFLIADPDQAFSKRILFALKKLRLLIPHIMVLAGYLILRKTATGSVLAGDIPFIDNPLVTAGTGERIPAGFSLFYETICLMILPLNMSIDYSYNALPDILTSGSDALFGFILFVFICTAAVLSIKKNQGISLGLFFLLITFSLISSTIFPSSIIFAERLLYLPSAGFCLASGGAVVIVSGSLKQNLLKFSAGILLAFIFIIYGFLLYSQIDQLKDPVTMAETSLQNRPGCAKLHAFLGHAYMVRDDLKKAEAHLKESLNIYPDQWLTNYYLSSLYLLKGDDRNAYAHAFQNLKINPAFPEGWINFCIISAKTGMLLTEPASGKTMNMKQICDYAKEIEFVRDRTKDNFLFIGSKNADAEMFEDARKVFQGGKIIYPGHGIFDLQLMKLDLVEGKYAEAAEHCRQASAGGHKIPKTIQSLFRSYGGCGN
jgi:tetratricopeptide (TPR) repeat protein